MAEEGADIIAVDICDQIPTVPYPMATPEDLELTVKQVEAAGRRIVARQADVRDQNALRTVLQAGVDEFGHIDVVCANAGISVLSVDEPDPIRSFRDVVDVNLTGVWNTIRAATPIMIESGRPGSIVLTGSTAGLKGFGLLRAGFEGYTAAKHGVVGLTRMFANSLAEYNIRVNAVHPTAVNTPMTVNAASDALFEKYSMMGEIMKNALPVQLTEPSDLSNAVIWLVSDEARYITGVNLPVDAGCTNR